MPIAQANGIRLCYEQLGPPDGEPMLMIMGLGAQLISWPDGFCELLTSEGFRVIRFDNRDVGRSEVMDHLGVPRVGDAGPPPYTLADMAADAAGLLDALDIASAHVVGLSLGGVVAQNLVADHRDRVLSLALVMTHPGRDAYHPPAPEAAQVLLSPRARTREERIDQVVAAARVLGSQGDLADLDRARDVAARAWDRGWHPQGYARQLAAIMKTPNRLDVMRRLDLPTVVLHGEDDQLVPVDNGRVLAETIPGARLVTFPGMGHDLPRPLWPRLAAPIVSNARRAGVGHGATNR